VAAADTPTSVTDTTTITTTITINGLVVTFRPSKRIQDGNPRRHLRMLVSKADARERYVQRTFCLEALPEMVRFNNHSEGLMRSRLKAFWWIEDNFR